MIILNDNNNMINIIIIDNNNVIQEYRRRLEDVTLGKIHEGAPLIFSPLRNFNYAATVYCTILVCLLIDVYVYTHEKATLQRRNAIFTNYLIRPI